MHCFQMMHCQLNPRLLFSLQLQEHFPQCFLYKCYILKAQSSHSLLNEGQIFHNMLTVIKTQCIWHLKIYFYNAWLSVCVTKTVWLILTSPADELPLPPTTHTQTLESKETKTKTLECKEKVQKLRISHVKNVNKRKNRLPPVKLESKKQDKKVMAEREGLGGKFPSIYRKKPRPTTII